MNPNKNHGLKNHSSSPSAIVNMQHHDPSGSCKVIDGSPSTIQEIFADTTEHAIEDYAVLRVANTTTSVQYLWVGEAGSAPGAPAIGDSIAIMPESSEMIFCGKSDDQTKSIAFKAGDAGLQVIYMYS